jgi:hypothetical protein
VKIGKDKERRRAAGVRKLI